MIWFEIKNLATYKQNFKYVYLANSFQAGSIKAFITSTG